jgi:hypothetical protein
MQPVWKSLTAAVGLIGLWTSPPAVADSPVSDELEVTAAPYMWFLELDGNATVKGQKSDVDVGFSDIWDNLNFGGMFAGDLPPGSVPLASLDSCGRGVSGDLPGALGLRRADRPRVPGRSQALVDDSLERCAA